jgi:tellurite resistance protein TerC
MNGGLEVSATSWLIFSAVALALLLVDLLVHRGKRAESHKSAIGWSIAWVALGLAFCGYVWAMYGGRAAQEYLGAYLIEKSLSLDNLFVFLVIFQSLGISGERQRGVLFWGIFGALIFRALFIFAGVEAIERWHAVVYFFGALLLVTAWRVAREDPAKKKESKLVFWLEKRLPVSATSEGNHFIIKKDGRRLATPLLIALISIELTDIAFAVDSVPAALAVSHDPFIVYTSNVFAILGLRALYIALAGVIAQLRYLHYGLAAVLAFAGLKMIVPDKWVHIPPLVSVAIIVLFIGVSVWASLRARKRDAARARVRHEHQRPGGPRGEEVHA